MIESCLKWQPVVSMEQVDGFILVAGLWAGQDEDVVKLYDLTSLCNEYPNRPWQNPFISPVAMLLYRVARNLSMSAPTKK